MPVCSQCHKKSPAGSTECKFCKTPFPPSGGDQVKTRVFEGSQQDRELAQDEVVSSTCPNCGFENQAGASICSNCETSLELPKDVFGETQINVDLKEKGRPQDQPLPKRYQVVKELGRGGMGVVYHVRDSSLFKRDLALKLMSESLLQSTQARERFGKEVEAAQSLTHENIVKVFHLDKHEDRDYFTMEYVPGRSLRDLIEERKTSGGKFSYEEACLLLQPVLAALTHAHRKGVIHRDLKPENIMVSGELPEVSVKVLDFGLARIMSPLTAQMMDMALYMCPEHLAEKQEVGPCCDLFSIGVILYELLTGELPCGIFDLPSEILPGIPSALDALIVSVLSKKMEKRPQTAKELAAEFETILTADHE